MSEPPRRMVVGVGNRDRGDDGVGRYVVDLLRGRLPGDVRVEERIGGVMELIVLLREADHAVLVDAMVSKPPIGPVSNVPIGTIRRFDCAAGEVAAGASGASSHGLGIAEAIGLARALSCLPRICVVFAVEAADFAPGADMSRDVVTAAQETARRITNEFVAA